MATADKWLTMVTNSDGSKQPGYIQDGRSYYIDGSPIKSGSSVIDSNGRTWTKPLEDAAKVVDNITNKAGSVVSGVVDAMQTGASRGGGAGRQDIPDSWPGSGPVISDTGQSSQGGAGSNYSVNLGDIFGGLGSLDFDSGWLSWLIPIMIVFLFLKIVNSALGRD